MRAPSRIAATTVVPMPVYSVRSSDARNTRRLATLMAVISRFAANESGGLAPHGQVKSSLGALLVRTARIASSASCDATSPALCPPMPSATASAEISGSHMDESSLIVRTFPGCVRVQTVSIENDLVMNRRGACYDTAAPAGRGISTHVCPHCQAARPHPGVPLVRRAHDCRARAAVRRRDQRRQHLAPTRAAG